MLLGDSFGYQLDRTTGHADDMCAYLGKTRVTTRPYPSNLPCGARGARRARGPRRARGARGALGVRGASWGCGPGP